MREEAHMLHSIHQVIRLCQSKVVEGTTNTLILRWIGGRPPSIANNLAQASTSVVVE